MIYDGFMFFNEFELLELRLNELDGLVDRFILVEANLTHSGNPKPLWFEENKARFEKWLPKIVHIKVLDTPATKVTWDREIWQRNAILRGVAHDAHRQDQVLIGDVDEIPKAETLRRLLPVAEPLSLGMRSYGGYMNARSGDWMHAKVAPYSAFRKYTPENLRHTAFRQVQDCGWHFSYSGGPEKVHEKMKAFSHQEKGVQKFNDLDVLKQNLPKGIGVFGGQMSFEQIDDSFPKYLREHPDRFPGMIWTFPAP